LKDNSLEGISKKMDIIINLLVNSAISGKTATEATVFLNEIGLSSKDIASILNVQQNVITARLSNAKKRGK